MTRVKWTSVTRQPMLPGPAMCLPAKPPMSEPSSLAPQPHAPMPSLLPPDASSVAEPHKVFDEVVITVK